MARTKRPRESSVVNDFFSFRKGQYDLLPEGKKPKSVKPPRGEMDISPEDAKNIGPNKAPKIKRPSRAKPAEEKYPPQQMYDDGVEFGTELAPAETEAFEDTTWGQEGEPWTPDPTPTQESIPPLETLELEPGRETFMQPVTVPGEQSFNPPREWALSQFEEGGKIRSPALVNAYQEALNSIQEMPEPQKQEVVKDKGRLRQWLGKLFSNTGQPDEVDEAVEMALMNMESLLRKTRG